MQLPMFFSGIHSVRVCAGDCYRYDYILRFREPHFFRRTQPQETAVDRAYVSGRFRRFSSRPLGWRALEGSYARGGNELPSAGPWAVSEVYG